MKIKHSSGSGLKLAEAREALNIIFEDSKVFEAEVATLTSWKVTTRQWDTLLKSPGRAHTGVMEEHDHFPVGDGIATVGMAALVIGILALVVVVPAAGLVWSWQTLRWAGGRELTAEQRTAAWLGPVLLVFTVGLTIAVVVNDRAGS